MADSVMGNILVKAVSSGKPVEEAAGELITQQVTKTTTTSVKPSSTAGSTKILEQLKPVEPGEGTSRENQQIILQFLQEAQEKQVQPTTTNLVSTHFEEIKEHFTEVQQQMFPTQPEIFIIQQQTGPTPTPSTQFMQYYAPGFTPITQRAELIGTGVIPSEVTQAVQKISIPGEIAAAGGTELYKQLAFEKYFLLPGYPETERTLIHTLKSSYWYMSTQPIYEYEKRTGLTFGELKEIHPALYLTKTKTGIWEPKLDVVRWRSEYEKEIGPFATTAERIAEVPLSMFDVDLYFAESKKEYLASKLYQSHLSMRTGDPLSIAGTWVGLQAPAWENIILPFVGGAILGKIFTSVKLAGGIARASLGLRAAYAAGAIMVGEAALFTGARIATEFAAGETTKGLASLTKLGMQLTSGAVGYSVGASSAMKTFETKYPNIYWGSEGVPVVGEKYVSLTKETIFGKGIDGGKAIAKEYGFYKVSQLFRPGKESQLYITFPETPVPFGAGGDITMLFGSTGIRQLGIGTAKGTTEPFLTRLGVQRAWSYKTVWGEGMYKVLAWEKSGITGTKLSGVMNVNKMVRLHGETVWTDITAAQTVIPGLQYLIRDTLAADITGFIKPTFTFAPGVGSFISPISMGELVFDVKPVFETRVDVDLVKPMVKPITPEMVKPVFEIDTDIAKGYVKPVFETEFEKPKFVSTISDVETIVNVIQTVTPVFETKQELGKIVVPALDLVVEPITTTLEISEPVFDFDFTYEIPYIPFIPGLGMGAAGAGGGFGAIPGKIKAARKRVHPVELYKKFFIGG